MEKGAERVSIRCPCCEGCGRIQAGPPVRLTPKQRAIYDAVRSARHGLPASRLIGMMYADDIDGGPVTAAQAFYVHVYKMNQRLAACGERIKSDGGFYRLFRS
jgi:hypothetical protein